MSKPPDPYKTIKLKITQVLKPEHAVLRKSIKESLEEPIEETKPPSLYESIFDAVTELIEEPIKEPTEEPIEEPKQPSLYESILDAVDRTHSITREAMFFLKHYVMEDPDKRIQDISPEFLDLIMQSVCELPKTGRKATTNKSQKEDLIKYYNERIRCLHPDVYEPPNYKHLNTVLDYAAVSWMTMIENNIKQRYVSYVEHYVNFHFDKNHFLEVVKTSNLNTEERNKAKRSFFSGLRRIVKSLLDVKQTETKSDSEWIVEHKKIVLPNKSTFEKDSIYYDVQCSPLDYLFPMICMMKAIEESTKENKPRLLNVFPLRQTLIPSHIRIDTTTLAHLSGRNLQVKGADKHKIWHEFFDTTKRSFKKKGYIFNNSILTDGISCCLLFIRDDLYGRKYLKKKTKVEDIDANMELYLDDVNKEEIPTLRNRNVVAIDPNMGNLLYCIDNNDKVLRYTQSKRKVDMRQKKFTGYTEGFSHKVIDGITVKQWEETLSQFDSKSLDISSYEKYLKGRFLVDEHLRSPYKNFLYRKLSLQSYRYKINSETKFITKFKKTYGNDAIVCIGDWAQKEHRKYKEPVKGKGFRQLFRKSHLELYLIDEHRTSLQCSGCQNDLAKLEKFYRRTYKTKTGKIKTSDLLHGLLRCKTCKRIWNRDANASRNQRNIANNFIAGIERPAYLISKPQALITG